MKNSKELLEYIDDSDNTQSLKELFYSQNLDIEYDYLADVYDIPDWIEVGDTIQYNFNGSTEELYKKNIELENLYCDIVECHYDSQTPLTNYNNDEASIINIGGKDYRYITTVGHISPELELQAENGDVEYYYFGECYIRILELIEEEE